MFKLFFIASLFILSVFGGAAFTEDLCNKVAAAKVVAECKTTASALGGSTACCLAKFTDNKIKIPKGDDNANNGDAAQDVKIVESPTSGSKVATQFYACFAPGGQFRFKTGEDTAPTAGKLKDAFAKASGLCGADGKTKVTAAGSGVAYSYCADGTCAATTDITPKCGAAADGSRRGLCLTIDNNEECTCGASTMPTDSCAKLASADVKTKCSSTSDGGSPAKKCCLATFDALPTTPDATPAQKSV